MSSQTKHDDVLSGMAVGVLAATIAAIAHEAIGHGGGCAAVGGHVSLLTSIFFDCDGATALTDAVGPLGSLLAASGAALALRIVRPGTWLFPFVFASFLINAGWFSGQLIYSAALDRDDWHYVARELHWPGQWRVAAIAIGVGLYWGSLRFLRGWTLNRPTLRRSYAAAAGSAALAGLFWSKAPFASAWEGALAVGVAPLGFLFAAVRRSPPGGASAALPRSWGWVSVSSVIYILFLALEARGIGRLARAPASWSFGIRQPAARDRFVIAVCRCSFENAGRTDEKRPPPGTTQAADMNRRPEFGSRTDAVNGREWVEPVAGSPLPSANRPHKAALSLRRP